MKLNYRTSLVLAGVALASTGFGRWVRIGPSVVDVQALAMSRSDPGFGYAATDNAPRSYSSVLRSTDGGFSWDSVGQIQDRVVNSMAGDHFDRYTVYATNSSSVIYRSTNGGGTWNSAILPNSGRGEMIAGDPFIPGLVYAAGRSRIGAYDRVTLFVSTDHGQTWSSRAADTTSGASGYACLVSRADTGTVYIGGSKGIVARTTNRGQTWTRCSYGLTSTTRVYSLDQHLQDPDIMVAGCSTGVYRTTNRGTSWFRTSAALPFCKVALSPAEPDIGYTAYDEMYVTTDAGQTWFVPEPGLRFGEFRGLAVHLDSGRCAFACGTEGIARTSDAGAHWITADCGAGYVRVPCIGVCRNDPDHIYTEVRGSMVYRSLSGGETWTRCEPFPACGSICALGVGTESNLVYALEGWT